GGQIVPLELMFEAYLPFVNASYRDVVWNISLIRRRCEIEVCVRNSGARRTNDVVENGVSNRRSRTQVDQRIRPSSCKWVGSAARAGVERPSSNTRSVDVLAVVIRVHAKAAAQHGVGHEGPSKNPTRGKKMS